MDTLRILHDLQHLQAERGELRRRRRPRRRAGRIHLHSDVCTEAQMARQAPIERMRRLGAQHSTPSAELAIPTSSWHYFPMQATGQLARSSLRHCVSAPLPSVAPNAVCYVGYRAAECQRCVLLETRAMLGTEPAPRLLPVPRGEQGSTAEATDDVNRSASRRLPPEPAPSSLVGPPTHSIMLLPDECSAVTMQVVLPCAL